MIVLDTSVLIDSLTGSKRSAASLRSAIEQGERVAVPALVLYEWLRGPRLEEEIAAQEALFPKQMALPFDAYTALVAAGLYRTVRRPRGREIDLVIAASALAFDADLWTLNRLDFDDIPRLRLACPANK